MSATIINFLDSLHPMSAPLKEALNANLICEVFPRHHLLLREGERCEHIYFVQKGLLRAFYRKDKEDVTSWLMKENDVVVSVFSFFTQQPSQENIELLEDSELVYIHYDNLQEIYREFLEFNVIGRLLTERYYVLSEERLMAIRKRTARERYQFILNNYPELLQRVSVKYIASYLGMTLETLSRVRGRY